MKRMVVAAALLAAVPFSVQAQSLQPGGVYIGLEGGANWMLNNSFTSTLTIPPFGSASGSTNASFNTGFVLGGSVGYDFVGPRIEVEGVYRENTGNLSIGGAAGNAGINFNQVAIMGNIFYDFFAGQRFVPYIGAGAGVAFL